MYPLEHKHPNNNHYPAHKHHSSSNKSARHQNIHSDSIHTGQQFHHHMPVHWSIPNIFLAMHGNSESTSDSNTEHQTPDSLAAQALAHYSVAVPCVLAYSSALCTASTAQATAQ